MVVREPMNYSSEITKETLPEALRALGYLEVKYPQSVEVFLNTNGKRYSLKTIGAIGLRGKPYRVELILKDDHIFMDGLIIKTSIKDVPGTTDYKSVGYYTDLTRQSTPSVLVMGGDQVDTLLLHNLKQLALEDNFNVNVMTIEETLNYLSNNNHEESNVEDMNTLRNILGEPEDLTVCRTLEQHTLTPSKAKGLLGRVHASQRRVGSRKVDEMCAAIIKGGFKATPQTIILNEDGEVLDGQHRLHALVKAGKSDPNIEISCLFAIGSPDNIFDVIDTGTRRTFAQMNKDFPKGFASTTFTKAVIVALTVGSEGRSFEGYNDFTKRRKTPQSWELFQLTKQYPDLVPYVHDHYALATRAAYLIRVGVSKRCSPSALILAGWLLSKTAPDSEKVWWEDIQNLDDGRLSNQHPLRAWSRYSGDIMHAEYLSLYVAQLVRDGRRLSKLTPHNAQVSLGLDLPRFTAGIDV